MLKRWTASAIKPGDILKQMGETVRKVKAQRRKSDCLCVLVCLGLQVFPGEQLLVVNLACAPLSRREVSDVCSIQKACWETVTDLSQAPWTPRTWPNAFRNSQMAAFEGFVVPIVFVLVYVYLHLSGCARLQAEVYVYSMQTWSKTSRFKQGYIFCRCCWNHGC